jgi:prolyl-tRNA synthetase
LAISPAGEDTLAICPNCGYAANLEVAISSQQSAVSSQQSTNELATAEEVATPNCATIADVAAFMGVPTSATAKAVFFDTPERGLVFAVIRGDLEVNEEKLRAAAGVSALAPASAEQIVASGAVAGYASPIGLNIAEEPRTENREPGANLEQRTKNKEQNGPNNGPQTTDHGQSGVFVIADRSIVDGGPLVAGANRDGYHLRNVVYGRDWRATQVADIAAVRAGDPCVRCGTALHFERGIEIGHIFKLGTRYTEVLGASYLDQGGAAQPVVMGSYGIGVERLLQVIVEQHHDQAGIVWPQAVAPAGIHLVRLGKGDAVRAAADALYDELRAAGAQVLYDDRDETAGVKFNDADLIGLPLRLLVSERLLAEGMVELRPRGGEARKVARGAVLEAVVV